MFRLFLDVDGTLLDDGSDQLDQYPSVFLPGAKTFLQFLIDNKDQIEVYWFTAWSSHGPDYILRESNIRAPKLLVDLLKLWPHVKGGGKNPRLLDSYITVGPWFWVDDSIGDQQMHYCNENRGVALCMCNVTKENSEDRFEQIINEILETMEAYTSFMGAW